MLDRYTNQASGLLGLCNQQGPRMIAVVAHGDEQAELPLLWQLCLALVSFGYAVTVLDATTDESDCNQGLEQLLDAAHWRDEGQRDGAAWVVLPAGKGIQHLCAIRSPQVQPLTQLGHLFPKDGVLILYCRVEWMIPLIGDCDVTPLLAVSPLRTSLLTSYLALKRLLITGRLKPTIVNMVQEPVNALPKAHPPASSSLSECAKKFLGYDASILTIQERCGEDALFNEFQGLALRVLESALALEPACLTIAAENRLTHFGHVDHFAGSH